jgi:hypothetical protein
VHRDFLITLYLNTALLEAAHLAILVEQLNVEEEEQEFETTWFWNSRTRI